MEPVRAENDLAWKEILRLHLEDFLEFFWTEAYEAIDWSKDYESLEQELAALQPQGEIGKRFVDKLFKVFLKTGAEQWVLVHLEVQHQVDEQFSERMYVYGYRIFDRYQKDVASLAVLADKNKNWRPNRYRRSLWG